MSSYKDCRLPRAGASQDQLLNQVAVDEGSSSGELLLKPLVLHLPHRPSLLAFAAHVLSVRHYADHFWLTGRVQQGNLLGRDPGIFGAVDDEHRRTRFA